MDTAADMAVAVSLLGGVAAVMAAATSAIGRPTAIAPESRLDTLPTVPIMAVEDITVTDTDIMDISTTVTTVIMVTAAMVTIAIKQSHAAIFVNIIGTSHQVRPFFVAD